MKDSKLISSLRYLNEKELQQFGDFVHSPFFNKRKETAVFFDFLSARQGQWTKLTKEQVFNAVFSNQKYRAHSVNNLMFSLMDLLNQFLGQLVYAKKEEKNFHIIEGTHEKSMWKLFQSKIEKGLKQIEEGAIRDEAYFKKKAFFEESKDILENKDERNYKIDALQSSSNAIETWFIIKKLRMCCVFSNRMMVYNHNYDLGMVEYLLKYLEERWDYYGNILLVNIYYQILITFREPYELKHFFKLVKLIETNKDKCGVEDLKLMYDFALVLGIDLLNQGGEELAKVLFKLYLLLIEDGLLIEKGGINHMRYKNIITIACRIGEFDWAVDFMNKYRKNLDVSIRRDTYNFNLANIYYTQKNYEEALLLLSKLHYGNVFYQLNSKVMQIKIFYELGEYEVLLSFLESFRLFLIRNKKVSENRIKMTFNMIVFIRKFVQILMMEKVLRRTEIQKKLEELQLELETSELQILGKKWLLDEINNTMK